MQGYRFEWEANVIEDRRVNAFCLPGGKIAVYSAILQVTQNDDQLATVLSHEIAHALAHHSNERVTREESGRVNVLLNKAFDRQQESEADHIGIFLMTFAGYNPEEATRFWERMRQLSQGREIPEILSDHPSDERRIRDIERWVPKAERAKRAFDKGNIASTDSPKRLADARFEIRNSKLETRNKSQIRNSKQESGIGMNDSS